MKRIGYSLIVLVGLILLFFLVEQLPIGIVTAIIIEFIIIAIIAMAVIAGLNIQMTYAMNKTLRKINEFLGDDNDKK